MGSGGAARARAKAGPALPESPAPSSPAEQAFNWPPTEEDLSEFQPLGVEDATALVSQADVAPPPVDPLTGSHEDWPVVEPAIPRPPVGDAGPSRRANLLGLAILLGLGTAVGAGSALLLSPRPTTSTSSSVVSGPGSTPGRADASRAPYGQARDPKRPPDVTIVAEYPSVDVRAPRGMLPGGANPRVPASPATVGEVPSFADAAPPRPSSEPASPTPLPMPSAPETRAALSEAPPPVAPAPVPAAPAPVPAALNARTAIERLLGQYRTAYERLDIRATAGVWPTVDTEELGRAFNTLSKQELTFERCDIKVADRTATADCNGELRYVRRVGRSSWQKRAAAWTFDLARAGETWTIQGVRAH